MRKINKLFKEFKEHKILFWMIVCFPVAIYRLVKYKIVPKFVSIILTIVLSLLFFIIIICVYDTMVNPTRVVDNKVQEELKDYNIGKTRELEYLGKISKCGIYDVITTKGYYHVYVSATNDKEIKIEGIKEILKNTTLKWSKNLPQSYKNLPAPIIALFIEEKEYEKTVKNIECTDLDQYLITYKDGTKYLFDIRYYKVYKIYEITNNKSELKYTCKTLIKFKKDFQDIINRNMKIYKNVKKINALEITQDTITYTFENFCGNSYRIIKYNDEKFDIQQSDDNISNTEMEKQWKQYKKGH